MDKQEGILFSEPNHAATADNTIMVGLVTGDEHQSYVIVPTFNSRYLLDTIQENPHAWVVPADQIEIRLSQLGCCKKVIPIPMVSFVVEEFKVAGFKVAPLTIDECQALIKSINN